MLRFYKNNLDEYTRGILVNLQAFCQCRIKKRLLYICSFHSYLVLYVPKKTKKGWVYWHVPRDLSPGFNFKISNVGPKLANHSAHTHPEEEIFYILEGTAKFSLNGQTKIVGPKSTLFCPSGISHGISNAGDTELTYAVIKANYPLEDEKE